MLAGAVVFVLTPRIGHNPLAQLYKKQNESLSSEILCIFYQHESLLVCIMATDKLHVHLNIPQLTIMLS